MSLALRRCYSSIAQKVAYTDSLSFLNSIKAKRLERISALSESIQNLSSSPSISNDGSKQLESMKLQRDALQLRLAAEDREVLNHFRSGKADYELSVYRYLEQQSWTQSVKPILLQRLEQMKVEQDLGLPIPFEHKGYIKLSFETDEASSTTEEVAPGMVITSEQTSNLPQITVFPFENEDMLCTLAMVDLDVPNQKTKSYEQACHLLITNVPVSPTKRSAFFQEGNIVYDYSPPMPPKGTKKHRIVTVLLKQSAKIDTLESNSSREFDLNKFAESYSLTPVAIHFFRQQWDQGVSDLYKSKGIHEPIYAKAPTPDLFEVFPKSYKYTNL